MDSARRERRGKAQRWFRITRIEVAVFLGLGLVLCGWPSRWDNIYCPAAAEVRFWGDVPDDALHHTSSWFSAPDHLVQDGRLFLRAQSTRPALFLVTTVDAPRWDVDRITRYRVDHPYLETMWPDPTRADGGVRWSW